MKTEFIVNGGVTLMLIPDNEAETELLKLLCKQDNSITELRSAVHVLNMTFKSGIVIGKKNTNVTNATDGNPTETEKV